MERATYCRICEPLCGLVATVEDGRLTGLRPDPEHPLSHGFACPKGIAMTEIQNDPDRVLHPLRRRADGEGFDPVSWEEALGDIGRRLRRVLRAHGGRSVGWYFGNPGAFSYSHALWLQGFMTAVGSPNLFTAGSQDINSRFVASRLLYGSLTRVPVPDLARTEFLLIVGANPLVSHGSAVSAPRIRDQLRAIVRRGGRVVVVDPRRSETARAFEHLPVRPDGDAWLLLSLLHVIFDEGLDTDLTGTARGGEALRTMAAAHPPEETSCRTGVPAADVRALARDLATAGSAAVYGRTGSNLGRHGTLVAFLLDALNVVTGNLDRPGGAVFGSSPLSIERLADRFGLASYGRRHSRVGGFPDVLGSFPAALMAREITTPGKGRIRAMFVSAGNPVVSVPDGAELTAALSRLDLLVAIDLYVNDTNRHADYVLPATTFLEREDLPVANLSLFTTPFVQYTEPVLAPYGEARQEWRIIDAIARNAGLVPFIPRWLRPPAWLPLPAPERLLDLAIRLGPRGDRFGLRRGLSLRALRRRPRGIVLGEHVPTGVLRSVVRHRDRLVRLDPPEIRAEYSRLAADGETPGYPLRLIGLREMRSQNSWMHNSATLLRGRAHAARIHPGDAAAAGVEDGGRCRITSPYGSIVVTARLTDEVTRGTVAVPHGWGHQGGGWRRANEAGGANVNLLVSSDPADLERLAGMAHLNGVPIRLGP